MCCEVLSELSVSQPVFSVSIKFVVLEERRHHHALYLIHNFRLLTDIALSIKGVQIGSSSVVPCDASWTGGIIGVPRACLCYS